MILVGRILAHVGFLERTNAQMQTEIERCFRGARRGSSWPQRISVIKAIAVAAILADIGAGMNRFPSAGRPVSQQ